MTSILAMDYSYTKIFVIFSFGFNISNAQNYVFVEWYLHLMQNMPDMSKSAQISDGVKMVRSLYL